MSFNTFPSNSVGAGGLINQASGFFGVYPRLAPDLTYLALDPALDPNNDSHLSRYVSGFDGDSDAIALPNNPTSATMIYYDSSGNQVTDGSWSGGVAGTDINAAVDNWVGFMRDTDGLIYMVGIDVGTTPDTYYLATINKAGTLSNIGNDQPVTDAGNILGWGAGSSNGAMAIYRTADGSGNIFVRHSDGNSIREAEINIATGAFVTDFVQVALGSGHYKTAAGTYVGNFSNFSITTQNAVAYVVVDVSGENGFARLQIPSSTGVPGSGQSTGASLLQWGGKLVIATNSSFGTGPKAFGVTTLDNWANRLLTVGGTS